MQTYIIHTVREEKPIVAEVPQFAAPSLFSYLPCFDDEKISSTGEVIGYATQYQFLEEASLSGTPPPSAEVPENSNLLRERSRGWKAPALAGVWSIISHGERFVNETLSQILVPPKTAYERQNNERYGEG